MLILLSPAKTLDFAPHDRSLAGTKPQFHAAANQLAAVAKKLTPAQIQKQMGVSAKIASSVYEYWDSWRAKWDSQRAKQAVLAYRGDVYQGLDADSLTDKQLERAQTMLRHLSGLYGLLRPLDRIQPYRLEMGLALRNERGKDLYAWWGDRITRQLCKELATMKRPLVVNLASQEYAAAVDLESLGAEVISPQFKELRSGKYKMISFSAKRARGMMARHLIVSRAAGRRAVESFGEAGYELHSELSTTQQPLFTRPGPS